MLRDKPGTETQHPRSDGTFFVQRVGSHLHDSLRSPPPTRREPARRATRGEKHRRYGAHNQNGGGNHTQLPVHHSAAISDLSQRAGSPRGLLGAKHNKSWNSSSGEPTDVLESCSRTQQCSLFCDWRVFNGAFGWGDVFHCLEASLGHNCPFVASLCEKNV